MARKPAQRPPKKSLETFPNPNPERDYTIRMRLPEFTCLCPKTGQPDFATMFLEYVPAGACVELKSLKLYVWSFRDEGAFHEAVTNRILDDLVQLLAFRRQPDWQIREYVCEENNRLEPGEDGANIDLGFEAEEGDPFGPPPE